ncbi:dolichyl-phosphate-mannose--protein mannosyltransferase [Nocardioides sp.]|uniref:dolichyl-phosphate-mannose--protein mannosyltransferase n=1 Tax=Nocardioides sp. TaxID=35761 RepID=UPI003D0BC216
MEGLSRTADGDSVPPAPERARGRLPREDPFVGWACAIGISLLALFLRLWRLGTPHAMQFDETYYAKDAWSLLHFGYTREYVDGADAKILAGRTTGIWQDDPSMTVHPEVGKWMIALGEKAFGMDPFGWRVAAAVVGSLMVLVMCRLARRLTGSTLLGCVAGLLLCFDGLQLVLSRLALLDIFEAFFILCAVAACVNDRDWMRRRLSRVPLQPDSFGPVLWLRPWLLVAGVSFGLACGTKWGAATVLAGFGVLVWVWAAGARRSFGVRWALPKALLVDAPVAFVHLVVVAFVVYVATWTGWLMHAHQFEEHLSNTQYTQFDGGKQWPTATEPDADGVVAETWQSLRSLYFYHQDVLTFHTHFLNDSTHTYQSKPLGWLFLNRPVGVDAQLKIKPGEQGCDAPADSDCLRQVLLIGTPVLWWGGVVALLYAVFGWVARRDWRYGVIVVGVATTWLPWFRYDDRPIFLFYAINILPFTVLALTMLMGRLLSAPGPSPRRTAGTIVAGSFFVLVVLNFAWFWPIWTDGLLTHAEWMTRIWFSRWI